METSTAEYVSVTFVDEEDIESNFSPPRQGNRKTVLCSHFTKYYRIIEICETSCSQLFLISYDHETFDSPHITKRCAMEGRS